MQLLNEQISDAEMRLKEEQKQLKDDVAVLTTKANAIETANERLNMELEVGILSRLMNTRMHNTLIRLPNVSLKKFTFLWNTEGFCLRYKSLKVFKKKNFFLLK